MVEKAVQYIQTHFESIRTVRDVAAELGVSYESLRKQFARSVGEPMQSFLSRVRVQKAQESYSATNKKLYAVAKDVGFADDAALRRQWKRHFGHCPREMRARQQNNRPTVTTPAINRQRHYRPDRPAKPRG